MPIRMIVLAATCIAVVSCKPSPSSPAPDRREQWRNAILGIQDGVKALNGICLKEVQAICAKDPTGTCAKNDGGKSEATSKATALAKTCADAFDASNQALYSGALIVDAFTFADVGRLACTISRASAAAHALATAVVSAVPAAKLPPVVVDGLKTADDFASFVAGGCTDGK